MNSNDEAINSHMRYRESDNFADIADMVDDRSTGGKLLLFM